LLEKFQEKWPRTLLLFYDIDSSQIARTAVTFTEYYSRITHPSSLQFRLGIMIPLLFSSNEGCLQGYLFLSPENPQGAYEQGCAAVL
jgi:hypothetical protein